MVNPELVRTLDYILNRCDEVAIDAVAEAVVRRRRELTMFGGSSKLPNPQRMARELSGQINIGASLDVLRDTIRDMAIRIIKQEAPELTEEQINELTKAWIPAASSDVPQGAKLPPDMLSSMIDQFVAFSQGTMSQAEEKGLRAELGAWPERYWKAFPQVVRLIITDYLKNTISEKEFLAKINTAIELG
jgi:hypothetical protein